ncbi:MAG TPA: COX15/CtaA family protein [Burkholderiales bacterium]|nr:COX15/CtaA family protein [Burkholderiales bacterium]
MKALSLIALALAFVVVVMGAYVRLSDAGLGCPDWPFCYGKPMPAEIADGHALAKAWKEMGHRYLAGALGLLILALCVVAWRSARSRTLTSGLVILVAFQAALGMWTVTMLLKPAIVTAHLLGGLATLALLVWLALRQWPHTPDVAVRALRITAATALAAVVAQVALGGWVSANYAALACPDLPLCRGRWVPEMDFANAFHVVRELGQTAQGELLSLEALTAIHWTHRVFALVAATAVLLLAARAWQVLPPLAVLLAGIVTLQLGLGIANVALGLPLALAAAHNAGAAVLIAALVVINFFSFRGLRPSR